MCRAGGRRCPGSSHHSRATQNARQQRSRATRALRKAKQSGDPDAIAAARERLDAVTTTPNPTASTTGQPRDVTPEQSTAPKDTPTMDDHQQDQDSQHRDDEPQQDQNAQFPGFVNVNIASGNATVGSQHDVHHGDYHADQQEHPDRTAARLARAHARLRRAQDRAGSRADTTNTNTVSGDEYVAQQNGWNFGRTTYTSHSDNAAPQ